MATRSSSPCAACKCLRRKCMQECVFAPYFPADQTAKFTSVHQVFGASNVAKILNDLDPAQREDAVQSLAYDAQARLQDPIYGSVGHISMLQHKLQQVNVNLHRAKHELFAYIKHNQPLPDFVISPPPFRPFGVEGMGMGTGSIPQTQAELYTVQQALSAYVGHNQPRPGFVNSPPPSFHPFGVEGMAMGTGIIPQQEQQQQQQQQQLQQQQQQQQHGFVSQNSVFESGRGFNEIDGGSIALSPDTLLELQQQMLDDLLGVQRQFQERHEMQLRRQP